jgi:hypothetical protein
MYTRAHSAFIPQGSLVGGWYNKTVVLSCGTRTQILDFAAMNKTASGAIFLCPDISESMDGSGASYQLYAITSRFNATNCVQALGIRQHEASAQYGCWQYA